MDWLPVVFALWLTVAAWRAYGFDLDEPAMVGVPLRVRLLMEVVLWPICELGIGLGWVCGMLVRLGGRLRRRKWWR